VLTNLCGNDKLKSAIHHTLVQESFPDTELRELSLGWNTYEGWPVGVERYEIWRKLVGHPFVLIGTTGPGDVAFASQLVFDGFSHEYVVRSMEEGGTGESWSNIIRFDYEPPVEVYNVFTPNNGDDDNQFFTVENIGLYHDSQLLIMNRWGR